MIYFSLENNAENVYNTIIRHAEHEATNSILRSLTLINNEGMKVIKTSPYISNPNILILVYGILLYSIFS